MVFFFVHYDRHNKNPPQADEYVRKEAAVGEDSKNILNVNF